MKKLGMILSIIIVFVSLVACDPANFRYDYEELENSIVQVELINYDNPGAKELFEKRNKVISFDFDKMEIIETLSEEQVSNFLTDLIDVDFMMVWKHLDSPQGLSIRMIYNNNDFEIISCNVRYAGSFYSDGQVKRFIGTSIGIEELVNKYFTTQI